MDTERRPEGADSPPGQPPEAKGGLDQDRLYTLIVGILGLIALVGTTAWFYSFVTGRRMPEGFVAITAAIIGALIGILVPQSFGRSREEEEQN